MQYSVFIRRNRTTVDHLEMIEFPYGGYLYSVRTTPYIYPLRTPMYSVQVCSTDTSVCTPYSQLCCIRHHPPPIAPRYSYYCTPYVRITPYGYLLWCCTEFPHLCRETEWDLLLPPFVLHRSVCHSCCYQLMALPFQGKHSQLPGIAHALIIIHAVAEFQRGLFSPRVNWRRGFSQVRQPGPLEPQVRGGEALKP
jgi:hypothetical protein